MIHGETQDPLLQGDVASLIICLESAIENKDTGGLKYAHRVIHDLDYHINGRSGDGIIYGVTSLRDDNIKAVLKYIQ